MQDASVALIHIETSGSIEARIHHSNNLETPLPVATGLFLHSKTRKRGLVDFFAKEAISMTHTRIDEIEDQQSYPFQLDLNEKPDSAYGLPESYTEIKPTL